MGWSLEKVGISFICQINLSCLGFSHFINELTVTLRGQALPKGYTQVGSSKSPRPHLFHYPILLFCTQDIFSLALANTQSGFFLPGRSEGREGNQRNGHVVSEIILQITEKLNTNTLLPHHKEKCSQSVFNIKKSQQFLKWIHSFLKHTLPYILAGLLYILYISVLWFKMH